MLDWLRDAPEVVIDIESNHADIRLKDWELYGCVFCDGEHVEYVEDLGLVASCLEYLAGQDTLLIGHNLMFDLWGLKRCSLIETGNLRVADTMIATNLLDENLRANELGLKKLILKNFGRVMATHDEASKHGKETEEFRRYARDDGEWTYRYWKQMCEPGLTSEGLLKIFHSIYMQNILYVVDQTHFGIPWSLEVSARLRKRFEDFRDDAEKALQEFLGEDINLNSNQQLGKRLFQDMRLDDSGVPLTEKSKQYQLNKEVLQMLSKKYPVCARLRDFRNSSKMLGTYLNPNDKHVFESFDGRIHPSTFMTSTTGRRRQQKPNMQNQPVISDETLSLRNCVGAPKGWKILVADLSQAELRVCGHVSQDEEIRKAYCVWQCTECGITGWSETLLTECPKCGIPADERTIKEKGFKGFWHGLDIHQMTADAIGVLRNPKDGNSASSKNVNFAAIYLCSAWMMQKQFGTYSVDEWEAILRKFFLKYKGVKKWHLKMEQLMYSEGVTQDVFGRKRRIRKKDIRMNAKHALNMFVNHKVQSTIPHYLMLAENKFRGEMMDVGLWETLVYPINEVHDECNILAREDVAEDVGQVLLHDLRYAVKLSVPMDAELKIVDSWGQAK